MPVENVPLLSAAPGLPLFPTLTKSIPITDAIIPDALISSGRITRITYVVFVIAFDSIKVSAQAFPIIMAAIVPAM